MKKTIIVPTDFSPVSTNALHYALEAAKAVGADVHLFHSYLVPVTISEVPVPPLPYEEMQKVSEENLKDLMEKVRHICPEGVNISASSNAGPLTEELSVLIAEKNPFAVIMGTRGSGGLERIFLGSSTLDAMQNLACPVIAVPPGATFRTIKKIGLATDFREVLHTLPAEQIHGICKAFHASLHIVNVSRKEKDFTPDTVHETFTFHNLIDDLQPEYHYIDHQEVEKAIHEFAETNNLDMILTIPKKHSFLKALFSKSHTAELVYHSHIPICAVHAEA